jgi:hypothetical protein
MGRRPCRVTLRCCIALAALALAGCGGDPSTWTVEEDSVDGVRPRMTFAQVHERWEEVASFYNNDGSSGASLGLSVACVNERPVLAGFWTFGPDDRNAELFFAWLFDRVRTEEGIRIGSTLDELRSRYGARLRRVSGYDAELFGQPPVFTAFKVVQRRPPPRNALLFGLFHNKVEAIGLASGDSDSSAMEAINRYVGGTC